MGLCSSHLDSSFQSRPQPHTTSFFCFESKLPDRKIWLDYFYSQIPTFSIYKNQWLSRLLRKLKIFSKRQNRNYYLKQLSLTFDSFIAIHEKNSEIASEEFFELENSNFSGLSQSEDVEGLQAYESGSRDIKVFGMNDGFIFYRNVMKVIRSQISQNEENEIGYIIKHFVNFFVQINEERIKAEDLANEEMEAMINDIQNFIKIMQEVLVLYYKFEEFKPFYRKCFNKDNLVNFAVSIIFSYQVKKYNANIL